MFILYLDRFLLDEDFLNRVEVFIVAVALHDIMFVVFAVVGRGGWSTLFDGRTDLRLSLPS